MKVFQVLETVPAIRIIRYNVEAENEAEAIKKVLNGEVYAVSNEYEDNFDGGGGDFEVELMDDGENLEIHN